MALLEELDSAPGTDKFPEMYTKLNSAIQTINAILGGGDAGEAIRKVSGTDFDFEFYEPVSMADSFDRQQISATGVSVGTSYTAVTAPLTSISGINRNYIVTANFTINNSSVSSVNDFNARIKADTTVVKTVSKVVRSGSADAGADTVTITALVSNVAPGVLFTVEVNKTPNSGGSGVTIFGFTMTIDGIQV